MSRSGSIPLADRPEGQRLLQAISKGSVVITAKQDRAFRSAVAEGERDRIRERIRDAKRHLAAQGVFSGGKRPFGHDIVEDGEIKRLVPNAAEQAAIARMQAMRGDGATYRAIGATFGMGPKTVQRILERVTR
jgi:putative DNA-invertase from lambdoid prophage Rac